MSRAGAHGFGHDMNEHKAGQGPVWNPKNGHSLLAFDPLEHWAWRDHQGVLPIPTNYRCGFISRPPDGQGHRTERGMQETRDRLFEGHCLYSIEQVGLSELKGMLLGCTLARALEYRMNLLPERQDKTSHAAFPFLCDSERISDIRAVAWRQRMANHFRKQCQNSQKFESRPMKTVRDSLPARPIQEFLRMSLRVSTDLIGGS
jgi:hypothetical protein